MVGVAGLQDDLARIGSFRLTPSRHPGPRSLLIHQGPRVFTHDTLFIQQGYSLVITPDSIVIAAHTSTGAYYGVQTLRQLVRQCLPAPLGCLSILDRPAISLRGVSDDISRGQCSTLNDFGNIIEHLGYYKLNTYCLYVEDHLRFWTAPELGITKGALTPSALRQLQLIAARHHVTLIPIFQSLAHQGALISYPRFARLAERPAPAGWALAAGKLLYPTLPALARLMKLPDPTDLAPASTTLSPANPNTLRAVAPLIAELVAAHDLQYLGLGGDEPQEVGTGASKHAVAQLGLGRVYTQYMSELINTAKKNNRTRALIYGDYLLADSTAMALFPRDVGIIDWDYAPSTTGASIMRFRREGFAAVIASAGLWNWNAVYPNYSRAIPNIAALYSAAHRAHADGAIVASWSDAGGEAPRSANWAGYSYAADAAWHDAREWRHHVRAHVLTEYGTANPALRRAISDLGWQNFGSYGSSQRLLRWKPTVKARNPDTIALLDSLRASAIRIRLDLASGTPFVRFNRDNLSAIEYAAAALEYAATRELTLHAIAVGRPFPTQKPSQAPERNQIEALVDSCTALESLHRAVWLAHNSPLGLDVLSARFASERRLLCAIHVTSASPPRARACEPACPTLDP